MAVEPNADRCATDAEIEAAFHEDGYMGNDSRIDYFGGWRGCEARRQTVPPNAPEATLQEVASANPGAVQACHAWPRIPLNLIDSYKCGLHDGHPGDHRAISRERLMWHDEPHDLEESIKELAEKTEGDVAIVWVRRSGNFKVFSGQSDITPESQLGTGCVTGGDDMAEGVDAALVLAKLAGNKS